MPTLLLDWLSSFPDNMEKQVQNVAIADAILHHELRIFVWDVAHNLKDRILAATAGTSLWSSIISAASRPMIEVFPSDQAKTEEHRRILETFF